MARSNKNNEGYSDPTASSALANISKEEKDIWRMMQAFKLIAKTNGYEITSRIEFKNIKSGREYK